MAKEDRQKLTLEAEALGFDQAAKSVAKITEAQAGLREEIEDLQQVSEEAGRSRQRSFDPREYMSVKNLAEWMVKLGLAITGTIKALRLIPAASAVAAGIVAIVQELKREVAERWRLVEVMRIQGQAADELRSKQQAEKDTLERIARTRREGGFAGPDVARRVQQAAERAQQQFTQLKPEDINLAFGYFGDIEGLSQQDLIDLAIIASMGGLQVDPRQGKASLKRQALALLAQYRESGRIAEFARTETIQGQGRGRPEYYTGQPTEAAQEAFLQTLGPGGSGALRRWLKEKLPPEYAEVLPGEDASMLDRAIALIQMFGTPEEFERAIVKPWSPTRGVTATANWLKGMLEVGVKDQPGYGSRAMAALGITKDFEQMRLDEAEELIRAWRRIQKEGAPGGGRQPPGRAGETIDHAMQADKEAAETMVRVADDLRWHPPMVINNNYQWARFVGPSARSQREDIENGQNRARSRRTG